MAASLLQSDIVGQIEFSALTSHPSLNFGTELRTSVKKSAPSNSNPIMAHQDSQDLVCSSTCLSPGAMGNVCLRLWLSFRHFFGYTWHFNSHLICKDYRLGPGSTFSALAILALQETLENNGWLTKRYLLVFSKATYTRLFNLSWYLACQTKCALYWHIVMQPPPLKAPLCATLHYKRVIYKSITG